MQTKAKEREEFTASASHKSLAAIDYARSQNVVMNCFPSHSTHPLDYLTVQFMGLWTSGRLHISVNVTVDDVSCRTEDFTIRRGPAVWNDICQLSNDAECHVWLPLYWLASGDRQRANLWTGRRLSGWLAIVHTSDRSPNIHTVKLHFHTPAPVLPCRCGRIRCRCMPMRADAVISHTPVGTFTE